MENKTKKELQADIRYFKKELKETWDDDYTWMLEYEIERRQKILKEGTYKEENGK